MSNKPGGLGKGLGALIRGAPQNPPPAAVAPAPVAPVSEVRKVPVASVHAGVWQPRKEFKSEPLDELIRSIRERGVLQPLLVRAAADGFELIAGERRLRAATAAGLTEVPVKVMNVTDREALELALIENLQREDLNPIEEAEGYRALLDRFELTQDQVAERVGRARASVANSLRLLVLADPVRALLKDGAISVGHAKVLLGLTIAEEQGNFARRTVKEGWSVRDLEREVARAHRPPRRRGASRSDVPETHLRDIREKLQQKLGTGVYVFPSRTLASGRKAKGRIEIEYYTGDDLDRLMIVLGLSDAF